MKKIFAISLMIICMFVLFKPTKVQASDYTISYIYVDLKGAVKNPGVYRVSSDARLFQLVEMAGGLTSTSNTRYINLAQSLEDEIIIYIPFYNEENSNETSNLININTATLPELKILSGIGDVLGNNIINYRTTNGAFTKIEDIKNVEGIGSTVYENIKEYITI